MNKKLFYEQPQIGVLHLNTEGLMAGYSNNSTPMNEEPEWEVGD